MNKKIYVSLILALWVSFVSATPHEIIIVRHGDKWLKPAAKWANRNNKNFTLNAKGMVRSVKLAQYILKKFGRPDYIFATAATDQHGVENSVSDIQTAGPLASLLADSNPHGFKINYPFTAKQYANLGKLLLNQKQYDRKTILIVWNHYNIPALVNSLGVKEALPAWPIDNFDSVYVLKYTDSGHLANWKRLDNQYQVPDDISWDTLSTLADSGK